MISFLAAIPMFLPPSGWNYLPDEKQPTFVAPQTASSFFVPRLLLTEVSNPHSPKEWIDGAIAIQAKEKHTTCSSIGTTEGKCGTLHLLHIDKKFQGNALTILQAIHFRDQKAYILTASTLTKEAADHYHAILDSFRSLNILDSIYGELDPKLATKLKETKDPKALQKILIDECCQYGPYFAIQVASGAQ